MGKLSKKVFAALEKCFIAELPSSLGGGDGLPAQNIGGPKLAARLIEQGLIDAHTVTLPGRFPVTIKGYRLTHAGRIAHGSQPDDPA